MSTRDPGPDPRVDEARELLIHYAWQETGIQLLTHQLALEIAEGRLRVELDGVELAVLEAPDDADASDLATGTLEAVDDVRGRIVEIRLNRIRERLPEVKEELGSALEAAGWSDDEIDLLELEVEEALGAGGDDVGWPEMEMLVRRPDSVPVRVPVNIWAPAEPVDVSELTAELTASDDDETPGDGPVPDADGVIWLDDDGLDASIEEDRRRMENDIAAAREKLHPQGKEAFDWDGFRQLYDITGFLGSEPRDMDHARRWYEHMYYVTFPEQRSMRAFAEYLRYLDSFGES